ncbi:MAG: gliding motility-associated C-terminal domain-containing protein [Bacteroidetes bacterium]|nr:gliding motility-associated C-terminal domain-containing protein [Bacteroidota bacterium]HET6244441.1 gliding motility-associated C-terminal domain-containing protein [Bacteroidia bacterium]
MKRPLPLLLFFVFSLFSLVLAAQPANNECSGAQQVCFGESHSASNSNAGADSWTSACHSTNNTTWYKFTTNQKGGNASVKVNSVCDAGTQVSGTLISSASGCNPSNYTELDCNSGSQGTFSLSGTSLNPHTTYYLIINSENAGLPSACTIEISISGDAVTYSAEADIEDATCFQKKGAVKIDSINMGPGPYTYSMLEGTPQNSNSFSELNVGNHTVSVTDAFGCKQKEEFYVQELNNTLFVNAGEDKTIIQGGSVQLFADGNGIFYLWNPPSGLNSFETQSPIASPGGTTTYTTYTYSDELCNAQDKVTVFVLPRIVIPNAFTPNGDGVNDVWQIHFINYYPDCVIDIYNRWGQKVFRSKGYEQNEEWDGSSLGVELPASTYFYTIDLNAKTDDKSAEIFRGSITIIK